MTILSAKDATAQLLSGQSLTQSVSIDILAARYKDVFTAIQTAVNLLLNSCVVDLTQTQTNEITPLLTNLGYTITQGGSIDRPAGIQQVTISWPLPANTAQLNSTNTTTQAIVALSGLAPTSVQGLKDVAFATQFFTQGGLAPYTYSLVDGVIPTGLTLALTDLASVTITSATGDFACSSGITITVGQRVCITGTNTGTGQVVAGNYFVVKTNGSTTFSLSNTTTGLSITTVAGTTTGLEFAVQTAANSIALTGTPTTTGNGYFTISVTDSTPVTVTTQIAWSVSAESNNAYYSQLTTALSTLASRNVVINTNQVAVPLHSYGQVGDAIGSVAADATYFYLCTGNYVNTSTNIWRRITWTSVNW